MKTTDLFSQDALKLLIETGMRETLLEIRNALYSALWVPNGTVLDSAQLMSRVETDKLKEHWKGRYEAAKSVVRHLDRLEPVLLKLYRLVPAQTRSEKSAFADLKEVLKRARRVMRTGRYEPRKR